MVANQLDSLRDVPQVSPVVLVHSEHLSVHNLSGMSMAYVTSGNVSDKFE